MLFNGCVAYFNAFKTQAKMERYRQFRQAHQEGTVLEAQNLAISLPAESDLSLKPYTTQITSGPENFRGEIEILVDGVEVSITDALCLLSESPKEDNVMYPVLITHRLLWEPANNEKNLLAAILLRTHNDPFGKAEPQEQRWSRWKRVGQVMIESGMFDKTVIDLPSIQECAKKMGKKGRRILNAFEAYSRGEDYWLEKTINLKWNETITAEKNCSDIFFYETESYNQLRSYLSCIVFTDSASY